MTTETSPRRADLPVSGREEIIKILQETGSPPPLIEHVSTVCERALKIAGKVQAAGIAVDLRVLEAGALLHDMGVPLCSGEPIVIPEWGDRAKGLLSDFLMHPIHGFQLAGRYGFPLTVRRCILCHTPGPTRAECLALGMSPPEEELLPVGIEEQLVMYADFLTWAAMLGLNPWQDARVMAEAGVPYFNYFWRAAGLPELTPDGPVAQRWVDAQHQLGRYAEPAWFGLYS